jgi:formylglycine-generating enzyme required for sulfatase activity
MALNFKTRVVFPAGVFILLANTVAPLSVRPSPARAEEHAPSALVSPFDGATAASRQAEWAAFLKRARTEKNSIGMTLKLIPPGEFMMGSPVSEKGASGQHDQDEFLHRVRITQPFYLGAYAIRVHDFRRFVEAEHFQTDAEKDGKGSWGFIDGAYVRDPKFNWRHPGFSQGDEQPVVHVTWNDAAAFCNWLSKKEGKDYRLPTEAEWEYSCRAGTTTAFNFGGSCDGNRANVDGKSPYGTDVKGPYLERTCEVGSYPPNSFGLYDMHGNAGEWCADRYDAKYYKNSPPDDPRGPPDPPFHVIRGGGWCAKPADCRSASRLVGPASIPLRLVGFRVVLEP